MALVSTVRKYTIKHVDDTADPVEIPWYPTSLGPTDNLVGNSWETMYGVFVDIPINLKAKVNWVYDCIEESKLLILYGQMIRAKIIQYKSRFFTINTYMTGVGFITGTFYLGASTGFDSLAGDTLD